MSQTRQILENTHDLVIELLPRLDELRSQVTLKGDDTPVTAADVLVQRSIEDYLTSQLDGLTFVGEEGEYDVDHDLTGWTAVVDPIDGTENFASSLPEWGVSVALWRDGSHEASMISLPELNKRLITGDKVQPASSRITAFSSGIDDRLVSMLAETPQARLMGCAVYNLYCVITGRFTRFVNPVGAYSWDLLAGLSLALEHNCEVFLDEQRYDGSYLEPGRRYRVDVRHRHDRHPG